MTSKVLQTGKIIEIVGSTIRIAHPNTFLSTALAAPIAAAGTAATVYDNNGFADDDWFIVGTPGLRETEECDVNGAVTRGQSLTFTNSLKFAHGVDTPVTKIMERAIKIYGASSVGGSGTLIASVDAITTPIADAVMIQWDKPYTEYTLKSTDTAYAYYFVKFTDGTTDSSASTYVPSSGLAYNKIEPLIKQAVAITNSKIDGRRLSRDMFVDWANDCQDAIRQFTYQDPGSGRWLQKDWSFEVTLDETIALVEGEDEYDLSSLTHPLKYPNTDKSIYSVQVGNEKPLRKMAIKDFDIFRRGINKTYANGATSAGSTTLVVDSTANFPSSGGLMIKGVSVTYTGKTSTTFTGIPASGSGSLTATVADNTSIWSNIQEGRPLAWVIFNGRLLLDRPPSSDFAGQTLRIRYLKELSRIAAVSDATEIPFTKAITYYLTAMASYRLGQDDMGDKWMVKFEKTVLANSIADEVPLLDEWHYYNYSDDVYSETTNNIETQDYYNY